MRSSVRFVILFAFSAIACEAGSCGPRGATPPMTSSSTPVASTSAYALPSSSASAVASAPAAGGPAVSLDGVTALASHPALGDVTRAMLGKEWKVAADALKKVLDDSKLVEPDLGRALFLHGRLLAQAKDEDASEQAYAKVPEASPLHVYACLRRAVILAKKGKVDDALALLAKVPDVVPLSLDRHIAMGDALAAKGDHAGAAAQYGLERKGSRWAEASIRYAEEVAAQGKAGEPLALDAAKGARRVRFEVPLSSLVPRAEEAEKKCRALLPAADAAKLGAPTAAELTTSAQAMLDSGKPKDALAVLTPLIPTLPKASEPWCKSSLLLARVHERLRERPKSSDVYGEVAAKCTDEATRVLALYDGAKIAVAAKQPDVARTRFTAVETSYPKHRLADDARVRGAMVAIENGDVTKGEAMLTSLPDDYPTGDMKAEAMFRLALPRMKKGEWSAAIPYLERSLSLVPREDGYFVAGRAAYFLGRAKLETGVAADGVERLKNVIAQEPFTFAAAMAYARLSARSPADAQTAKKAVTDGIAFEPQGALYDAARPELATAAFARAVELARVGESDAARRELTAVGLLRDANADPEGQWIAAALFAKVGDARAAHGFPRNRLADWQRHYPAGKFRAAWEIAFPRPYVDVVDAAATKEGVPTALIYGVMREESAFDPDAVSPAAAYGLLQLIAPTAAHYAKALKLPSDPHALVRPDVNVPLGTAFLKKLRNEFPNNPALAVPSYNAGEGATHRWLSPPLADSFDLWVESIPYEETRRYTKRVLASYFAYVALYDSPRLDAELRLAAGK